MKSKKVCAQASGVKHAMKEMRKGYDAPYIKSPYNTVLAPAARRPAATTAAYLLTLIVLAEMIISASAQQQIYQKCSSNKDCEYSGCSNVACSSSAGSCKNGAWDVKCDKESSGLQKSSAMSKFCTITSGLMDYARRSLTDYERRQSLTDEQKCMRFTSGSQTSICPCNTGYTGAAGKGACRACVAGRYKSEVGNGDCTDCGAGKYGNATGQTACTACSAGKYGNATGQTAEASCTDCSAGKYGNATGQTAEASCTACSAGKYGVTTGQTAEATCTPCIAGKYGAAIGQTAEASCTACSAGKYTSAAGNDYCTDCGAGKYTSAEGKDYCTACSAGKYGVATGQTAEASCTACGAGKYGVATGQTAEATCKACSAGKYGVATGQTAESTCTACNAGKYGVAIGQTAEASCTTCSAGKYTSAAGNDYCTDCGAGKYTSAAGNDYCTACSAGKYGVATGQTAEASCTPCSAGKYTSAAGKYYCTDCGAGQYTYAAGSDYCTACIAGKYGVAIGQTAESTCTACGAGKYGAATGQTAEASCTACSVGKYGVATDNNYCTDCGAGKYGVATGQSAEALCKACNAGKYGAATGQTAESTCTDCSAGKYGVATGQTEYSFSCVDCAAGKYSEASAATTCVGCASGKVSGTSATTCQLPEYARVSLSLPMTREDFNEDRQKHFKQAIANVAGVNITHVSIDKIEPIARRVETIRVHVSIAVAGVSSVEALQKAMTNERVNEELSKVGLPNAMMLETGVEETPLGVIGAVVGALVVCFILAACYVIVTDCAAGARKAMSKVMGGSLKNKVAAEDVEEPATDGNSSEEPVTAQGGWRRQAWDSSAARQGREEKESAAAVQSRQESERAAQAQDAARPRQSRERALIVEDYEDEGKSAVCNTRGCTRETWNGQEGEQCCRTCNNSNAKSHGPECEQKIRWHNYSKSSSLPDLWESQGRSEHKLYDVNRNGSEFSFVQDLFMKTMRNHRNSTITCIQRVENALQHDAYKVQRRNIAMDITKAAGTVSSAIEHQFVNWLFHGTKQDNIEQIVNSQATGYLPMLAGCAVGAIWGNGTYFARDAKYSHDYTEAKIDVLTAQSQRKMLLNRVIVGELHKGAQGISKFPMAKGEKYRQCNSLVNDVKDPSIFVIQHSNQAYPSYVITYTTV